MDCQGVFLFVGAVPNTAFVSNILSTGYIETDNQTATSVEGIFAAGDVRKKTLRQISTAVGDGALAATMADRYLEETEIIKSIINRSELNEQRLVFWSSECGHAPDIERSSDYEISEIDCVKNSYVARYFEIDKTELERHHISICVKKGYVERL